MDKNNRQFHRRIIFSIAILLTIYIIGFLGYMLIEKMSFLDAIFMATITISTVGFELIKKLSNAGTVFTIILIISGTGTAAYILISLTDFVLSELLSGRTQARRVRKMISKLKNHYIKIEITKKVSKDLLIQLKAKLLRNNYDIKWKYSFQESESLATIDGWSDIFYESPETIIKKYIDYLEKNEKLPFSKKEILKEIFD